MALLSGSNRNKSVMPPRMFGIPHDHFPFMRRNVPMIAATSVDGQHVARN